MRVTVALSLFLALAGAAAHADQIDTSQPVPVRALHVVFSDHGTGASGKPQRQAMSLIAEGIAKREIGFYKVLQNGHHGEVSFCIEANTFFGSRRDLAPLFVKLNALKPHHHEEYDLHLKIVESCTHADLILR